MAPSHSCAVIGGGPAGLMAAEVLSEAGCAVTIYDQMPSLGRKLLMAGVGGLNLTHSEDAEAFLARYRAGGLPLAEAIAGFGPADLRAWCDGLGQETFIGSSGRVFPKTFKSSPLLRAWLHRLGEAGVQVRTRHRWTGWTDGALTFDAPDSAAEARPDATVLALGGASWARLGSDGRWAEALAEQGIETAPFQPSNCGFDIGWQQHVGDKFGGTPLKSITLSFGETQISGEAMITKTGLEGGAIYALSPLLRESVARHGEAILRIDLKPDMTAEQIADRLAKTRSSDSMANRLRKALRLPPAAIAVLREAGRLPPETERLADKIKSVPLRLIGVSGIDRAISTAGGVMAETVDAHLMLTARPGTFVAGEMLDWEAPTGGYLLQACFATGRRAAIGVLDWLGPSSR